MTFCFQERALASAEEQEAKIKIIDRSIFAAIRFLSTATSENQRWSD
ncbi:Conserved hypothetical protein [Prochlorococcus marinus str. MIT 9313]|uniref:Uncharacterized protein n=1 Tax=Prochlorococcus marinus (strain MIT 9313) TaxID=74547 RepID=B9ER50_PROMM|nr:Conserved hypothetical protein [Prochlorococcus marinus str. MIT 9313]